MEIDREQVAKTIKSVKPDIYYYGQIRVNFAEEVLFFCKKN
jgi:hypothetical protein